MQAIKPKVVATTLLVIVGLLLLNIDRCDQPTEARTTIAAAAPAKLTAVEPVTPDARPAPDGASLERFKARVAQIHRRPAAESTTPLIDEANPPELERALSVLRDQLADFEALVEGADRKLQQLAVSLAVPPDLQDSAPRPAVEDPDEARPYDPYFAAARQRINYVRMRDLLRLQIQQEEIANAIRPLNEGVDFDR